MREMTNFLENVISGNKERTFVSIDQQRKVRIPLLIPKKTDKNVTRYSTNIHEISGYPNLKANPNRVQLQNITQAAILYATYTTLGDNHQDLLHVNKTLNAYMRGGDINGVRVKRYSKEAEQLVNNAWGDVFKNLAPELNESINSTAKKLIDTTLNELAENGELEAAQVKIDKAKRASKLFLTAFNTNLLHSKDTPLTTATAISEVYSSLPEKIEKFYKERYQSAHPKDYLYTLMTNHTSDIQDICDAANINFDQIKNYITFIGVNQQSGEDTAIASADYKKARVNNKKNVRGKINAYIKEDQQWNGVYHLLINVTHYEGQANLSNSIMLYSHNELATDSHSPNLLAPFLREESKVRPLIDENRALQLAEEQIKNQINQAESIERLKQENKEKREVSISEFLNLQLVETVDQLQGTYFDQKGISELVIKHMPNMRIDDEKNVWLPLVNVAEQDAEIDNVEGFQKYLPQKSELSGTNKLFEGVGEGRKNQACAVIGDIESASIIIESEGVANGLLAVEMAQQQGIEVAAVCGLDVGNLPHTTGKIIASHPTKPVINLADNDLFNSDKEQRYLLHEIAALNLPDNQKTRNVGMVRAIEMTNTINLPHITFDFENDFSQNLIDYQRDRKGSDIDDALNFLYEKNATLGIPSPADAAWNEVSQVLADKITLAMQYNVSPHWTVEQQHNFAWCASTENLNTKALNDYYHLKEVIDRSHDVFLENHNLPYEVYRSAIRTKHAPMIEQEIEVDENLTQVFEQAIDEHLDLESSIEQIEENNPIQHRSEPIPALDNELPHLMSPTIIESTIYVDTKINSITRKLDNIEKSLTKMPGYEYQKRLVKNMAVLHRLVDEKSRLLGVSSQQIQQTSELALYFDREAELTSAIEMTNMQVDFVPSEEDWTELDAAEKLRTASRDEHLYDFQVDTGSEEEPSATLTQRTPEELLNEILKDIPDEPRSDIDGSQKVIGPEQTADAEQPEGAQPESSIQTTHEGDSEPTVAESTVDQNVTESELTTDVEQPEGAQPESLIQTTHEGDSEPTVAESTVDQNVTES
ncbi:hypothetical protein, partial [Vibrio harveyi]|uniref:hypothetical protein n=1 Tax=Vibrio harveyi TaxID=669 RepID=UPI00248045F7